MLGPEFLDNLAGGRDAHVSTDQPGLEIVQHGVVEDLTGREQVANVRPQQLLGLLQTLLQLVKQSHRAHSNVLLVCWKRFTAKRVQ